jgi:hypothetical protein
VVVCHPEHGRVTHTLGPRREHV